MVFYIPNYTVQSSVIPAPASAGVNLPPRKRGAGIHNLLIFLDSRVRGNDGSTNTIFL